MKKAILLTALLFSTLVSFSQLDSLTAIELVKGSPCWNMEHDVWNYDTIDSPIHVDPYTGDEILYYDTGIGDSKLWGENGFNIDYTKVGKFSNYDCFVICDDVSFFLKRYDDGDFQIIEGEWPKRCVIIGNNIVMDFGVNTTDKIIIGDEWHVSIYGLDYPIDLTRKEIQLLKSMPQPILFHIKENVLYDVEIKFIELLIRYGIEYEFVK